jgi:2'-5' RNA ligase
MIRTASLDKEYFIVLLPEGLVLEKALKVQSALSNFFDKNHNTLFPQVHITLDRIKKEYVEETKKILKEIAALSSPVTIKVNEFTCFNLHKSFLVLSVEKTESLLNLANNIHDNLREKNISTIDNYNEWNFHITIASTQFVQDYYPKKDFTAICSVLEGVSQTTTSYAKSIEIWRPTLDLSKKYITSIPLNN